MHTSVILIILPEYAPGDTVVAAPEVVGVAARGRTGRCNSGVRSVVGDGTVGAFGCAVTFGALAISSSLLEYSPCDLLYIWKV